MTIEAVPKLQLLEAKLCLTDMRSLSSCLEFSGKTGINLDEDMLFSQNNTLCGGVYAVFSCAQRVHTRQYNILSITKIPAGKAALSLLLGSLWTGGTNDRFFHEAPAGDSSQTADRVEKRR
jgi:hypothetical protein